MNEQGQQVPSGDSDVMNRITLHDQDALSELYEHYGRLVYSLALRILGKRELAEEVTQDTFLTVWNHAETWSPDKGRLTSWLLTMTRYKSIDCLRREQRRPDMHSTLLDDDLAQSDQTSQTDDPLIEDGRVLRSLLPQLPPEQAQAIELAFFQGMTHSAMAEFLNIPLGTVKTRVRLGLQKLKLLWEETGDAGDS